jgi:lysyl-tRNA synthetase class 2
MNPLMVKNICFRSELLRNIRQFFYDRNFCEVQTPVLSADTIVDCYIDPLAVADSALPLNHHGTKTYFLQTSPEFAMKRLLADGMEAVFQIAPVFRKGDRGQFHNIEFTMLEWYRVGDDYQTGMALLAELVQTLIKTEAISFRSYRDIFETTIGINPHRTKVRELQTAAEKYGIASPDSYRTETVDAWLHLLFSEMIQPKLDAVIVYDYPASQSQLAQLRQEQGIQVSERFELFLKGIEIANGYHELCDASELRRRFQHQLQNRLAAGSSVLPIESRLLAAMESHFPPCSGTALGIDRLLMVMLHAETIDEVLAFPFETA